MTYVCQLFLLQEFQHPVHLIEFELIVEPESDFKHILLFECENSYFVEENKECLPNVSIKCFPNMIFAWKIGPNNVILYFCYFKFIIII
jgi:hypothetical protein